MSKQVFRTQHLSLPLNLESEFWQKAHCFVQRLLGISYTSAFTRKIGCGHRGLKPVVHTGIALLKGNGPTPFASVDHLPSTFLRIAEPKLGSTNNGTNSVKTNCQIFAFNFLCILCWSKIVWELGFHCSHLIRARHGSAHFRGGSFLPNL